MLPTIDFGSIGVLVAIGGFIKTVISYIYNALIFVKDQVVVFATGSRIWATAFFLLLVGACVYAFNHVFTAVTSAFAGFLLEYSFKSFDFEWEISVVNQAIPVKDILDLGFDFITITGEVLIVQANIIFFRKLVEEFRTLVSAFKT